MKKKYRNLFIVLIIITLILPTVAITNGMIGTNNHKLSSEEISEDDKKIIEDISNMTGVKTEEIVKLKNQGATWNEVLDKLKIVDNTNQEDRNARNIALATSGLDSELVRKFKSEGFKEDDITKARMNVDRVMLQLSEITTSQDASKEQALSVSTDSDMQKENDLTQYVELSEKIDTNNAIYLILKLNKDFKTMENALDEYLLSLQIEVKLENYIVDKKAYETEKNEKMIGVEPQNIITMAKIEEKMLEIIQQESLKDKNTYDLENGAGISTDISNSDTISQDLPLPFVGDSRPKNPTEDVMEEVNDIIAKSQNIETIGEGAINSYE